MDKTILDILDNLGVNKEIIQKDPKSAKKFYQKRIAVANLKHPQKYVGKSDFIEIRSSWEAIFIKWCECDDNILEWASEEIPIKYVSPIDKMQHTYFPDFYIKVLNKRDKIVEFIVEVKPKKECVRPNLTGKKKTKTAIESVKRYLINQAKWTYAKIWCKEHGYKFEIVTEKELGI